MENKVGRIVDIGYVGTLHGCSDAPLIDQEVASLLCDQGVGWWHKFHDGLNEQRIAIIQLKKV
jgi:hypothetical protein